jgi:hypothetical protein
MEFSLLLRSKILKEKNIFQKLCSFEVFSAINFVISRLYGHINGIVVNTKIKTKSQKVLGNVLYYLGPKNSKTKINFKSYEHLIFFSVIIFVISRLYGHTTGLVLSTKIETKSQKGQENVLYYLGPKYSNTKINFQSYDYLNFFSCHYFFYFKTLRSHHRLRTQHQNEN